MRRCKYVPRNTRREVGRANVVVSYIGLNSQNADHLYAQHQQRRAQNPSVTFASFFFTKSA